MTKEEILKELEQIGEQLDMLQETELFQSNDVLMNDLGEAIGNIDNTIAILEKKTKKYKFIIDKRVCEEVEIEASSFDEAVDIAIEKFGKNGVQGFYEATLFDDDNDAIMDYADSSGWQDAGYTGKYTKGENNG